MIQRSHSKLATKKDLALLHKAKQKDIGSLRNGFVSLSSDFALLRNEFASLRKEMNDRFSAHDSQFEIVLNLIRDTSADTNKRMDAMEGRIMQAMYNGLSEHGIVLRDHEKRIVVLEKTIVV